MLWHYAVGSEQRGPVDDAELDRRLAAGEITPETLVWHAGLAGWRPLREARAGQILGQAMAQVVAATPAPAPRPVVDVEAEVRRLRSEGRGVAPIECLRRGWTLVFADPASSIGVSAIVMLAMIGSGFVPCVGSIVQLIATGPLVASWYLYFLKRIRGQPTEWGDAIAAFSSPMLTQLVLEHIVTFVITLVALAPMFIGIFFTILGTAAAAAADERLAPLALVGFGGLFLVSFAVMFYLTVSWMFALPLILDKQIDFWPAMKLSWRVAGREFLLPLLGLLLLCGLVYLAGLLALCVGIFVAAPICVAALAYAYEDLFGERIPA